MDEWIDHLDLSGAENWGKVKFNQYLLVEKKVPKWWATQILSRYDDEKGVGISGLQKNGLYRIIVVNMTSKTPEDLFARFVSVDGFAKWIGSYSSKMLQIGSEYVAADGSLLLVENFDDVGWIKFQRKGPHGVSTTHVSFRAASGKRGATRIEIAEGNIPTQVLVKPYRELWRSIADRLME